MSAPRVSEAGGADFAKWDRYARSHPRATVYHLAAWRRIFGEALGYRSRLLMAKDAAGAMCGMLPLYLVPGLFGRRLVAVPFRDRGGPVFDTLDALAALLERARDLAREEGAGLLLKALEPLPDTPASADLLRHDHWMRSRMPLEGMTRDALWERVGDKNRNMVRQARQHGLVCARVAREESAAERWYLLHAQTQHRLGVPPFPRRFFALMLEALAPDGIEMLEVHGPAGACAATLLLFHRDTCIYGYSASSAEGRRTRANDLMLFEALALAAERKLAWFDFGSDSPAQESLLFFKRKWGAEQHAIPVYASQGVVVQDNSYLRYALARGVFRAMPQALSTWIGSRVVRRFG
jgi:serine/alanine adding enzyme